MGKNKQAIKEKRFNRNVEISAPILDPEIVKAIHTPPKGLRRDLSNGGFKALLSNLNSQDSTDDLQPLNDNHMPSYIGISCAVSGYSNYSHYNNNNNTKRPLSNISNSNSQARDRSRTTSPSGAPSQRNEVHHITIDKSSIKSPDQELKVLTEKLTASASERYHSPSSAIPPIEDDRHHGAYVGARYCPLPKASEVVHKHIPLLGIDDEKDPQEAIEEEQNEKKVEQKIASLYGDNFVEDWRESMNHKAKKELPVEESQEEESKNPKDLATLKPTPAPQVTKLEEKKEVDTPNIKVLANVEKEFLNKLLTDENPPVPSPPPIYSSPTLSPTKTVEKSNAQSPAEPQLGNTIEVKEDKQKSIESQHTESSLQGQSAFTDAPLDEKTKPETPPTMQLDEEHIEYEIRAQSPVDNESSPIRNRLSPQANLNDEISLENQFGVENEDSGIKKYGQMQESESDIAKESELVSFSPEPLHDEIDSQNLIGEGAEQVKPTEELKAISEDSTTKEEVSKDGHYYLALLDTEKSFIIEKVNEAEESLSTKEDLDDETVGQVRSVIGKANLLINKKFNQFKDLCEANINKKENEQFATLDDDLAGFWDLLNIQVTDVRKSFETMWTGAKNVSTWNNGNNSQSKEDIADEKHAPNVNIVKSIHKPKLDVQKDQARRDRLLEHINQMKLQTRAASKLNAAGNLLGDPSTESELESTVNQEILSAESVSNDSKKQETEEKDLEPEELVDSTTTTTST